MHGSLNDNELFLTRPSVFLCIWWHVAIKNQTNPLHSQGLSGENEDLYSHLRPQMSTKHDMLSLELLEHRENGRQHTTG